MSPAPDNKETYRDLMRERLRELTLEEVQERSVALCKRLAAADFFEPAQTVMVYLPVPGEVDIAYLALRCFQEGKTVCVPRMDWKERHMQAIEIRGFDDAFEQRKHGVREPIAGRPIPTDEIDLVLVPGLAFDSGGRRLGRGGGFYDRFLAQPEFARASAAMSCGVCFDFQIIETVPALAHDVPVRAVASDRRLVLCAAKNRFSK